MTDISGSGVVQSGMGGAAGYGKTALPRADDGMFTVDLSAVFENGFLIGGAVYDARTVTIATDGFVQFGAAGSADPMPSTLPFVAAFLADVDTRLDGEGTESGPIWLDIDPQRDVVTITWADVGFYRRNADLTNRFQIQLFDQGAQGVDIVLRYDRINWTSGDLQGGWGGLGGAAPFVGYRLGGALTSLTTAEALLLPQTPGNTGVAGLWLLHLPGAGPAAGAGNDLLQGGNGDDQLRGQGGDDTLIGGPGADLLDGGDGFDWVSYATAALGVVVDVTHPTANRGEARGDQFTGVEAILGSNHADTLVGALVMDGGAGADVLIGADGAATLFGGTGNDTFQGAAACIFGGAGFDWLRLDTATHLDLQDDAQNTLTYRILDGIEAVQGSASADRLSGNGDDNTFAGGSGTDMLQGRDGNDLLMGDAGDDTLDGGAGADRLFGGEGQDWVSYRESAAGLRVDLAQAATNTGAAEGDSFADIEGVLGSAFADTLLGGDAAELIDGGAGDDIICGRGGDDTLIGGDGDDLMDGGAGTDWVYGGAGQDTVTYSSALRGQILDLRPTQTGPTLGIGDRLDSIEVVIGSNFGDRIRADDDGIRLDGGGGDDGLIGGAGADDLRGGVGNDTLFGGRGDDLLTGGRGNDLMAGGAGGDQFVQTTDGGTDWITDFTPEMGDLLVFKGAEFGIGDFMIRQDSLCRFWQTRQDVLIVTYLPTGEDVWIMDNPNQHLTHVPILIDGFLYDLV